MSLSVLITFESFYDGGAEMFAIRLANALAKEKEVGVTLLEVQPYYSNKKQQLGLVSKKVYLVQLGKNCLGYFLNSTGPFRGKRLLLQWHRYKRNKQLLRVLKKRKITIINSHCWQSDVFFRDVHPAIKLVSSLHGHYELLKEEISDFDKETSVALERANHVVFLTKRHLQTLDYFQVPHFKRSKIFYGIDYPIEGSVTQYREQDILELVLIARGIKEKGWRESIEAFERINKRRPNRINLHLVGEGEFLEQIKTNYHYPNLFYHGYQNDVREFILKAHVGLLPTYYMAESLPNTIIEYLFCGKPVIASNVGAIPEMLDAGDGNFAGIIIDAEEMGVSSKAIEQAIEQYLKQPALVSNHSKLALKASSKFTMERCTSDYLSLFNKLV